MKEFDEAVSAIPAASTIQALTYPKTVQAARAITTINKALADAKEALQNGLSLATPWVVVDIKHFALTNDSLCTLRKVYSEAGYKAEHWIDRADDGKETFSVHWG